jgi:hypothetical protein
MGVIRTGLSFFVLVLAACSSTGWVHPNKPKEAYAQDYNACETQALQDPKQQGGNKLLLQQAIERCLAKKGWMLPE